MATTTRAARTAELDDDAAIFADAITEREPDADVPDSELAWWLFCQERAETRAALADAGLM